MPVQKTRRAPAAPSQNGGQALDEQELRLRTHAFVQGLLLRTCMKESKAKSMFTRLTNDTSDEGYLDFIQAARTSLAFLQLGLKRQKFMVDGEWYVGVVNQVSDEVSKKHGTTYSLAEVHYLRTLVTSVATLPDADNGEGFIRATDALNVQARPQASQVDQDSQTTTQSVPTLTLSQKESALSKFKEDQWLVSPDGDDGLIGIGVRCYMELSELLLSLDLPDATRTAWEKVL